MKTYYEYLTESRFIFTYQDVYNAITNNIGFDWYDLYPDYSKEFDEDEETMFNTEKDAENYANFVINMFNNLPNPIPIYRAIYAKEENDIDIDDPGESWSFYRESAISFGSHNSSNFLLSAFIDEQYVNWKESLNRFVVFTSGDDADDENEIVVADESKIKNIKIEKLKFKRIY